MFFMLLRDVYQHANSEDDRITNTRVFRADWLTEWAVFVHGQGLHTPHHLYPAVPHYYLEELHSALKDFAPVYASRVVECDGTFANQSGLPTILDVMTTPR
jgi:fatty acid desaturase